MPDLTSPCSKKLDDVLAYIGYVHAHASIVVALPRRIVIDPKTDYLARALVLDLQRLGYTAFLRHETGCESLHVHALIH